MIKDIGIEGLRCPPLHLETHGSIRRFNKAMSIAKERVNRLNMGEVVILEQGSKIEFIDVTTADDTERKFIPCMTGNQGTM